MHEVDGMKDSGVYEKVLGSMWEIENMKMCEILVASECSDS